MEGHLIDRSRLLRLYYLATPVFAAIDLLIGISIRASGIAGIEWRLVYYVFAFCCFLAIRYRPAWTPLIGIGESGVNLFLLILSVMGPLFAAPNIIAEGGDPAFQFGIERMLNVLIAGTVLIFAFHGHQTNLARQLGLPSREEAPEPDESRGREDA